MIGYPNPFTSMLYINTEAVNFNIYIITREPMAAYDTPKQQFDVSKYSNGLYLLKAKLSSSESSLNYIVKKKS